VSQDLDDAEDAPRVARYNSCHTGQGYLLAWGDAQCGWSLSIV
jgi:hypothetical protein